MTRKFLSRMSTNTKGIASLEFVLILFPMLFIFFGMIQFGGIFYWYNQMQNSAREAARRLAVDADIDPTGTGGTTVLCTAAVAGSAEDYACRYLSVPGAVDVTTGYCEDPLGTVRYDAVVRVTAPMSDLSMVDLLGISGTRTVTATAVLRVDPAKSLDRLEIDDPYDPPACPLAFGP